jgi:hypothetical protein
VRDSRHAGNVLLTAYEFEMEAGPIS